jgi:NAD(P)H-dependent FMN reductase
MTKAKILALAGSTRSQSLNKQLIAVAARMAREAGADVTLLDLRDYAMPLYDGDLEAASGLPEKARELKRLFAEHQGLLIASPEYNSSVSAVLKNAIDWISRHEPGDDGMIAFKGKIAAIMSASPGALGGLRGLVHLRSILGNIQTIVIPEQIAISRAQDAFDAEGNIKDERQAQSVRGVASRLVSVVEKLN